MVDIKKWAWIVNQHIPDCLTSAFDAVDGSSTCILMYRIAVVIQEQRMTAIGT